MRIICQSTLVNVALANQLRNRVNPAEVAPTSTSTRLFISLILKIISIDNLKNL
jgi:hypothetical protein